MGRSPLVTTLILLLAAGPARAQQTSPPPAEPAPAVPTSEASLGRIRRALAAPETKLNAAPKDKPLFSVEIVGKKPPFLTKFSTAMLVSDVHVEPGSAWHREFLAMVTPQWVYSSEIFPALDRLIAGLETAAVLWLAKTAIKTVSKAITAAELRAVREQIQSEVAEIEARKRVRDARPWLYVPF